MAIEIDIDELTAILWRALHPGQSSITMGPFEERAERNARNLIEELRDMNWVIVRTKKPERADER